MQGWSKDLKKPILRHILIYMWLNIIQSCKCPCWEWYFSSQTLPLVSLKLEFRLQFSLNMSFKFGISFNGAKCMQEAAYRLDQLSKAERKRDILKCIVLQSLYKLGFFSFESKLILWCKYTKAATQSHTEGHSSPVVDPHGRVRESIQEYFPRILPQLPIICNSVMF